MRNNSSAWLKIRSSLVLQYVMSSRLCAKTGVLSDEALKKCKLVNLSSPVLLPFSSGRETGGDCENERAYTD